MRLRGSACGGSSTRCSLARRFVGDGARDCQRARTIFASSRLTTSRGSQVDGDGHSKTTGTVAAWRRARAEVIEPTVVAHDGRVVKLTGDGVIAEFPTVEHAVNAALAMQQAFTEMFADSPEDRRITFRMGANIGDIWVDADDIYGAGVNIAARLETLAEPGGLCISGAVYDSVKHKIAAHYDDMGVKRVKNVAEPIRVWRVRSRTPDANCQSSEPAAASRIRFSPMVAWPLLAFVLVGLLVISVRGGDLTQLESSMLSLPPRVLTERAREVLAIAGHRTSVVDSHSSFVAELPSPESSAVANAPVRAVRFMYRQSPTPIAKGTPPSKYLTETRGGRRGQSRSEKVLARAGLLEPGEGWIPAPGVPLNRYGNVRASLIGQILSAIKAFGEQGFQANITKRSARRREQQYFFARGSDHLERGIYQRAGSRRRALHKYGEFPAGRFTVPRFIKPVLLIVDLPSYSKSFDFVKLAANEARRRFVDAWPDSLRRALATERRRS